MPAFADNAMFVSALCKYNLKKKVNILHNIFKKWVLCNVNKNSFITVFLKRK